MSPKERHAADARIQSAALRHYAQLCRKKTNGMVCGESVDQLNAWARRADQLADSYERLELALAI